MNKGDTIPVLKCGRLNNFVTWREEAHAAASQLYGNMASVIITNVEYQIPAVNAADFQTEGLSNKAERAILQDAVKIRYRMVIEARETSAKFFATLLNYLSYESMQEVRQHERFDEANAERNPTKLWWIIYETHFSGTVVGGGKNMMILKMQKLKEFNALTQKPGERVAVFKRHQTLQSW